MIKNQIQREAILNAWAGGATVSEAAAAAGILHNTNVSSFLAEARGAGEPRALRKEDRGTTLKNVLGIQPIGKFMHRKRLGAIPADPRQMRDAIASYTGTVTLCQPGFHYGHRPHVLDVLDL